MYSPLKRVKTITRREWVLDTPATAKDLADTLFIAQNNMEALGVDLSYDDCYHVTVGDDQIIVYLETSEPTP